MKKSFLLFMLVVLLLLCACSVPAIEAESSESETGVLKPSGYPDGELQKPYLFVEGTRYVYTLTAAFTSLPENVAFVGQVSKIDNIQLPDEELEAARLALGDRIYRSGDKLLVEHGSTEYYWFAPDAS